MNKNEILESYGVNEDANLFDICKKACVCLGNGKHKKADQFIYEIMGAETGAIATIFFLAKN